MDVKLALVILLYTVSLIACSGGGSPGGNQQDLISDDDNTEIDQSAYTFIGNHKFNADMITDSQNVIITYHNSLGEINSRHEIWDWESNVITYANEYYYSYDNNGKVTEEQHVFTYLREAGLEEIAYRTSSYLYNNAGQVLQIETLREFDNNADGVIDETSISLRKSFSYDANGNLIEMIYDQDGDGLFTHSGEYIESYTYLNGYMNSLSRTLPYATPPPVDITNFEYDATGNLIREELIASWDIHNKVIQYEYDTLGRLVAESIDEHGIFSGIVELDGIADTVIAYVYGNNNEVLEKIIEEYSYSQDTGTSTKKTSIYYMYDIQDSNLDTAPETSVVYQSSNSVWNQGSGYPAEVLPDNVQTYNNYINDSNINDGFGLNWDGHSTGTCSTCGNMIGEVNRILLGF